MLYIYNIFMQQSGEYSVILANENHRKPLISLLDNAFEYVAPQSYATDFAPCFTRENLNHTRLILIDDIPVACGHMTIKTAITPSYTAKIAVIGAIGTHPNYRNKGLSTAIIESLLKDVDQNANLVGTVLWSDRPEFYKKFNFNAVGEQHLYDLSALNPQVLKTKLKSFKLQHSWPEEQIINLHNAHTTRILRDANDWHALRLITSCERFSLLNSKGVATAYAGIGRGKDMSGIIHEWGGAPQDLIELVNRLLLIAPGLMWLTNPVLNDPIAEIAINAGVQPYIAPMGLFRPAPQLVTNIQNINPDSLWFWGLDSL